MVNSQVKAAQECSSRPLSHSNVKKWGQRWTLSFARESATKCRKNEIFLINFQVSTKGNVNIRRLIVDYNHYIINIY